MPVLSESHLSHANAKSNGDSAFPSDPHASSLSDLTTAHISLGLVLLLCLGVYISRSRNSSKPKDGPPTTGTDQYQVDRKAPLLEQDQQPQQLSVALPVASSSPTLASPPSHLSSNSSPTVVSISAFPLQFPPPPTPTVEAIIQDRLPWASSSSATAPPTRAPDAASASASEPTDAPPRRRSYTKANPEGSPDLSGEILIGEGWRRHTRVFGGGVCLACQESERRMNL